MMRRSLFLLAMTVSGAAGAQSIPTNAPPITGPASAVVGTTATYNMCWRGPEGVPYIWQWRISGSVTVVDEPKGPDGRCTPVVVRFATTPGNARFAYESSANGRPWPSPPVRMIPVRWPTLTDTAGPYRITAAVTRNGRVVGPITSRDVSETDVVRLSNGVTSTAPRDVSVVCADIRDIRTGWTPRTGNTAIRRCKRI